jgi:dTDP-glucose 4,6-dehydratase
MKIVVTGGAGFIGSNFVYHLLKQHPDYEIVVLDSLTYAGNLRNLDAALASPRVQFVRMDIGDRAVMDVVRGCDAVAHLAAESHVDRSIEDAAAFVRTNVEGTWNMLEACRRAQVPRFLHVSTDEVYGSLGEQGKFTEETPLAPNSPYAATKAASDLMVLAYVHTHHFPAVVTRCSNNYGPFQFPEKFIPLMITQAMAGQPLPIYGDGLNIRDWIHVEDHCAALEVVLHHGLEGEVYNIGGDSEMKNIDVAKTILRTLDRSESLLKFVVDRPGHDRRYAIDCTKLKDALGWQCRWSFADGLAATIDWYRENTGWLELTRSGGYRDYFDRHYVRRESTFAAAGR